MSVTDGDNAVVDGIRPVSTLITVDRLKINKPSKKLIAETLGCSWFESHAERSEDVPVKGPTTTASTPCGKGARRCGRCGSSRFRSRWQPDLSDTRVPDPRDRRRGAAGPSPEAGGRPGEGRGGMEGEQPGVLYEPRRPDVRDRRADGFKRITEKAGLGRDWTPRELRHTFVSLLSDSGVPIEQIADAVGHSSPRTTEVVYRHQLRPVTRTAAIALGPMFESKGKSDRSQS
jgi:Phage integrase family